MIRFRPPYHIPGCKQGSHTPHESRRFFATTRLSKEDTFYETLGLRPDASTDNIKKQYFHLSKLHHPDRNPSDPTASDRFMRISEAYATLSDSHKRSIYDRSITPASRSRSNGSAAPRGSYTSASAPYGARPASGLSRRRTQFKGPPPSFFRHGGRTYPTRPDSNASRPFDGGGGMGHGQGSQGNDVPHFDMEGHFRTQMSQEDRLIRKRKMMEQDNEFNGGAADLVRRFLLVSGMIGLAFVPAMFWSGHRSSRAGHD